MRNKFIIGLLGLVVVVAGIAAFSAFTAQLINLEAHVEKEIELAAVKNCVTNPNTGDIVCEEDDGNFGTVIPQEVYDKKIELTLSRSFFDQDRWFDVTFDVLWECKQIVPAQDIAPKDGFDDCREIHDPADPASDPDHKNGELDGRLRDSVQNIIAVPRCILAPQSPTNPSKEPIEKDVKLIGSGVIDKTAKKCFYTIKLLAPPCSDSFNSATDPLGTAVPVNCHFVKPTSDPQTWEHFADIGDEFKIQVTGHSLTPPCFAAANDLCIDGDGIATAARGAFTIAANDPLIHWGPPGQIGGGEGIDTFDNDSSGTWTFGDDIHLEDNGGSCGTGVRDAVHNIGKDCKVLDLNGSLIGGEAVSCDLEGFLDFDGPGPKGCPALLSFHDANGNGVYDNGEDIILDVNNNNKFD